MKPKKPTPQQNAYAALCIAMILAILLTVFSEKEYVLILTIGFLPGSSYGAFLEECNRGRKAGERVAFRRRNENEGEVEQR